MERWRFLLSAVIGLALGSGLYGYGILPDEHAEVMAAAYGLFACWIGYTFFLSSPDKTHIAQRATRSRVRRFLVLLILAVFTVVVVSLTVIVYDLAIFEGLPVIGMVYVFYVCMFLSAFAPHSRKRIRYLELFYYMASAGAVILAVNRLIISDAEIFIHDHMTTIKSDVFHLRLDVENTLSACLHTEKDKIQSHIEKDNDPDILSRKCQRISNYLSELRRIGNQYDGDELYALIYQFNAEYGDVRRMQCFMMRILRIPISAGSTCAIYLKGNAINLRRDRLVELKQETTTSGAPTFAQIATAAAERFWIAGCLALFAVALRIGKLYAEAREYVI